MAGPALYRVLITGGAGFLGSHLVDRVLAAGDEVLCLDDLSSADRNNIAHLAGHDRFTFIEHDITAPLPADLRVDRIFNLACPASPIYYQRDPVRTIRTNVMGTIHLLELARQMGAAIFQASTSEVYGDPEVHPQFEGYWGNVNPIGPRSCYDEGKRCAETLFFDYRRQYGLDIKVARIFNTYGPRMQADDGRVVSNFIVQALRGEPITIFGDGNHSRSFCYVDDLIEAVLRLIDSDCPGPINLGNPQEISVRALAELIVEMTGSRSQLIERPLPGDDPRRRRPDIALARERLGWEPVIDLREGLGRTIAHFEAVLSRG